MVRNLYDVLLVEQTATLDEIKLAFKKRALQVHPDKGGSKEAFHLVYQALETLSDPQARRKYDQALASCGVQSGPVGKRRQTRGPVAKKRSQKPEKSPKFSKHNKPKCRKSKAAYKTPRTQAPQCTQTQLLMKISELLKQLPRDVRHNVITKQFSQKQRLILENWMVENAQTQKEAGTQELPPIPPSQSDVGCEETRGTEPRSTSFTALALQTVATSPRMQTPKNRGHTQPKKLGDKKAQPKSRVRGTGGCVCRWNSGYKATIKFGGICIYTGRCDLHTALEYLVILTSVKQKMLENNTAHAEASFEERLEAALAPSANEQGQKLVDLNLRFSVYLSVGLFCGKSKCHSPAVRSIQMLGKLRKLLEPFRNRRGRNTRAVSCSPVHLEEAWDRFQKAVAEAWEVAGSDSTGFMKTARARYDAFASSRKKAIEFWERQHMAMQDKNTRRPKALREKNPTRCSEHRERQHMALEDKNRHRPRHLRVSSPKSLEEVLSRKLLVLKRLLVRWENLLNQKVRSAEKEHLKALRQRKLQRKQDKERQRRLEVLNRKRIREEERLRRETLCKRMKSSDFMDDLQWIWWNWTRWEGHVTCFRMP